MINDAIDDKLTSASTDVVHADLAPWLTMLLLLVQFGSFSGVQFICHFCAQMESFQSTRVLMITIKFQLIIIMATTQPTHRQLF